MATTTRNGLAVVLAALVAVAALLASDTPATAQQQSSSTYIAPTASTSIPVYDTAWQMFALASPDEADEYFAELKAQGFSGAWAAVISHAPSTYNRTYRGSNGELIGEYTNGEIVFSDGYIAHINTILDKADAHGMKVGLVVAWQNLYLPGGLSDDHVPKSDEVRGTLTTANADAYGRQMVEAFGSHPAVNAWIFGGDAGSNNTADNIAVWDVMADAIRDEGSTLDIGIHLPPYQFDSLLYADVDFLDFAAPEIGHNKTPAEAQFEMEAAIEAYDIPVWMGEARYFNSNFKWLPEAFQNPGAAEMEADAQASKNAGVSGYLYGDSGRWNWCAGYGDNTPCDSTNIADSFGAGEAAALAVFEDDTPTPTTTTSTTTTTTTTTAAPTTTTTTTSPPVQLETPEPVVCDGRLATIFGTAGDDELTGTDGPDVIAGLQGNDTIYGLGGDDVICGGKGDDLIVGGQGFDILFGAQGDDLIFSAGGDGTTTAEVLDDVRGARIFAGAGNDTVVGSDRWDRMQGGPGNDHLLGFGGNDWMRGGPGADTVVGHRGNDDIYGGGGNDRIDADVRDSNVRGGAGTDTCTDAASSDEWRGCSRLVITAPANPTLSWGAAVFD